MSSLTALLAIVAALLIGAISPGPSFLLVSRIAAVQSRLHGLAAAAGMGAGSTVFAGMALLGLVALLSQISWLHLFLKLTGGLYLVWLGVHIWRGAKEPLPPADLGRSPKRSLLRSFSFAFLTQLSNPKTAVIYGSIFAAMLPASPPSWLLAALPPLVFAVEFGWYAVATVFSSQHPRSMYLRAKVWADRLAGTVMTMLGLRLILDAAGRKL